MPGLFRFRAYAAEPAPVVELPDGRRFSADDPAGHQAVSKVLGRAVTLAPETTIPHHDEGPVSLLTTASLRALTRLSGGEPDGVGVNPLRFRANLLIDVGGTGFPEDEWPGRNLRIGTDVVLRVIRPLTRCVMIDMPQDRAVERNDLLKILAEHHELTFGVFATVEHPGQVAAGDVCSWE
jgi:MOSC domain-containing protein